MIKKVVIILFILAQKNFPYALDISQTTIYPNYLHTCDVIPV